MGIFEEEGALLITVMMQMQLSGTISWIAPLDNRVLCSCGGQERNLLVVPIDSKIMSEAKYFTPHPPPRTANIAQPAVKPPPAKLTFPPDFFDMNRNNIIIGDFNSHNHLWGYRDDDENGLVLEEWISAINFHLTHDSKLPNTFNSGRWKRGYNPDLACVSQNLRDIILCQRRVYDHIPRSQHRPHGVAINPTITPSEQPFRRRYNFKKDNWETFTTTLDNGITSLASPWWKSYNSFSDLVRVCARKCIPRGCQTKYISGLTPESGEFLKHYQENCMMLILLAKTLLKLVPT